jgi:hypothetical protein
MRWYNKPTMKVIFFLGIFSVFTFHTKANTVVWNLNNLYSITQTGIANAISDARNYFSIHPDDSIIIQIDSGTYNIGGDGSYGIDLSKGMSPGLKGRLIFQGAGMNKTTLVFTDMSQVEIYGRNIYRVTFKDMHMTRAAYTVSQGIVDSVSAGIVILNIQTGFPTPKDIFDSTSTQGRFLRKYTNSTTDPQMVTSNNPQIAWDSAVLISTSHWKMILRNKTIIAGYNTGDLIGIKSKHEGETYWIWGGNDISFENMKYTHSSRGLARGGTGNLTVKKCRIERPPAINGQTPCMSTPSGGWQMNQPLDSFSTGMVVENCYVESPGDDAVAFFNVDGGSVINTQISNSFARGIYIIDSARNICLSNNILINNPILGNYTICRQSNDPNSICSGASISFVSDLTGYSYQWQVKTDTGFANISAGLIYSGTNTDTLNLINAPSNWYGNTYRCSVINNNGNYYSKNIILKFSSIWFGNLSDVWEEPDNWSCGNVPDSNTDVIINSGLQNYPVINSNASCRSININPTATLKVNNGFGLNITGENQ